MRRGRAIGIGVVAAVAAVAVATGAAAGVSHLTTSSDDAAEAANEQPPGPNATPSAQPTPPAESPSPTPTATHTPTLEQKPVLAPGDTGLKVRELQHRLQQIAWYEPKMTGEYDDVTRTAVEGFQAKRGFEATGEVDRRTWKRLLEMTRMPTDDEMHNRLVPGPTILGPGDSGVEVRELQARLKQIGWFDAEVTPNYGDMTAQSVAGFQTKREIPSTGEVDQRTLDRLHAMTSEPSQAELFNRAPEPSAGAPLDPRCQTGRVLCIDKSSQTLRWVVDGTVQSSMEVRFGSEELPTREGQFAVNFKSRDHVSSLYDTPMPYAMFFSGGQAVHYSPDFAANGYNGASHGCVNVRDHGAVVSLFNQVHVGDKVVVYWS